MLPSQTGVCTRIEQADKLVPTCLKLPGAIELQSVEFGFRLLANHGVQTAHTAPAKQFTQPPPERVEAASMIP